MPHRTRYPNLYQLVGESISQLSADIAQRVEDTLSRPDGLMPLLKVQMDVDRITGEAAQRAGLKTSETGTLAGIRHTVAGITILTRMMYAVHIARTRGGPLQVVPSDAMEGLLLAARELTCHAQLQLRAERSGAEQRCSSRRGSAHPLSHSASLAAGHWLHALTSNPVRPVMRGRN